MVFLVELDELEELEDLALALALTASFLAAALAVRRAAASAFRALSILDSVLARDCLPFD